MAVYSLILLVLLLGLGRFAIFALERPPNAKAYREALRATAQNIRAVDSPQNPDDSLKIYAVNVFHSTPFEKTIIGDGIYLGNGMILTASHVVGNWPSLQNPRVLVNGQDLPAHVIKEGSLRTVDLALVSVDKSRLPVSLLLRRMAVCKGPLRVGTSVLVVSAKKVKRSEIISPAVIAPELRAKFGTVIRRPEDSGSGVIDAKRKCLLGIMSRRVQEVGYRRVQGHLEFGAVGSAGYFVPASKINAFLPPRLRP